MKLTVNLKTFLSEFVTPILDIAKDGKTAIFSNESEIYSLSSMNNNAVILYNTYTPFMIEAPIPRINLNLSKIIKGLNCAGKDQPMVDLNIENNQLTYADNFIKFNIKLMNDNIIALPKIDFNKILVHKFENEFVINASLIQNLKHAADFAAETSKFYIQSEGERVYITFGDRQVKHENDIRVLVCSDFQGNFKEKVYDISIMRLFISLKSDATIKIGENGALLIQIKKDNSTLNYLTTLLKK